MIGRSRAMRDFDTNDFPQAYLITFRCYGTWLHGDKRGSMDRQNNIYGSPRIATNPSLLRSDSSQLKHPLVTLNNNQSVVVERAARAVCEHRKYFLHASNVRSNHVHVVVSAEQKPELVLGAFKSYSTRALRVAGLTSQTATLWARHGSTVYLWKERHVAKGIEYVMLSQGDELFTLN